MWTSLFNKCPRAPLQWPALRRHRARSTGCSQQPLGRDVQQHSHKQQYKPWRPLNKNLLGYSNFWNVLSYSYKDRRNHSETVTHLLSPEKNRSSKNKAFWRWLACVPANHLVIILAISNQRRKWVARETIRHHDAHIIQIWGFFKPNSLCL